MYGKSLASAFLGAFCPLPFQRFIPQKTENKSIPENTCELSKLS